MSGSLRCDGPHPEVKGWVCNAPLNVSVPRGYDVRTGSGGPRCIRVTCWKCGRVYYACPTDRAA